MSELIDRNALMDEFASFVRRSNSSDFAPVPTWNDAVSLVGSMPSTEWKGYWIEHENPKGVFSIECSECGCWFLHEHLVRNSFCPNCGARMVEGEHA